MSARRMGQVAALLLVGASVWWLGEINLHVHRLPLFLGILLLLSAAAVVGVLWLEPKKDDDE